VIVAPFTHKIIASDDDSITVTVHLISILKMLSARGVVALSGALRLVGDDGEAG
jgi:hypothetical protein